MTQTDITKFTAALNSTREKERGVEDERERIVVRGQRSSGIVK